MRLRRFERRDAANSQERAQEAGLRYVNDVEPGIRRMGAAGRFKYVDASGRVLSDSATIARIHALAIPPAWTEVWICASDSGHLQATGRDARGRKQYRYHTHWRIIRDANKYEQLKEFVRALPAMRAALGRHLRLRGLPREKILATVVTLLETTLIRVGNARYARENGSFGLTTLRNRHVKVRGQRVHFDFRGKSGKQHHIELDDARMAAIVRRCRELPGQELFQYVDAVGAPQTVTSTDVNEYLRAISGGHPYTAKDFRTWGGTVLAALAMRRQPVPVSETQAKRNIAEAIRTVAQRMGNTPAICRKCYVHPGIVDAYREDLLTALPGGDPESLGSTRITRRHELEVLRILQASMRSEGRHTAASARH